MISSADTFHKPDFFVSTYYIGGGIMLIILLIVYFLWSIDPNNPSVSIMNGILTFCFILLGFYMLIYHSMQYILTDKQLILKCGPFVSTISYDEIKKIKMITSLGSSPVGLCRFPNFLLSKNYFPGYGWLIMYATSHRSVILIETNKKKYGITPKNDFISLLHKKIMNE